MNAVARRAAVGIIAIGPRGRAVIGPQPIGAGEVGIGGERFVWASMSHERPCYLDNRVRLLFPSFILCGSEPSYCPTISVISKPELATNPNMPIARLGQTSSRAYQIGNSVQNATPIRSHQYG